MSAGRERRCDHTPNEFYYLIFSLPYDNLIPLHVPIGISLFQLEDVLQIDLTYICSLIDYELYMAKP